MHRLIVSSTTTIRILPSLLLLLLLLPFFYPWSSLLSPSILHTLSSSLRPPPPPSPIAQLRASNLRNIVFVNWNRPGSKHWTLHLRHSHTTCVQHRSAYLLHPMFSLFFTIYYLLKIEYQRLGILTITDCSPGFSVRVLHYILHIELFQFRFLEEEKSIFEEKTRQ